MCWGLADFTGGLQTRRRPVITVLLIGQLAAVVLSAAYVALTRDAEPPLASVGLALGAGAAGCGVCALGAPH